MSDPCFEQIDESIDWDNIDNPIKSFRESIVRVAKVIHFCRKLMDTEFSVQIMYNVESRCIEIRSIQSDEKSSVMASLLTINTVSGQMVVLKNVELTIPEARMFIRVLVESKKPYVLRFRIEQPSLRAVK